MKWIDKMVERITRKETALNDHFCVNRHTVVCQSGMTDYVSVTIDNTDGFYFDFWTKQLCFEKDCKYRSEIKAAFDKIYGTRNIECCE